MKSRLSCPAVLLAAVLSSAAVAQAEPLSDPRLAPQVLAEQTAYVQRALLREGTFGGIVDGSCGQETAAAIAAYMPTVWTAEQLSSILQKLAENPCGYAMQATSHLWQKHGKSIAEEQGFALLTKQDVESIEAACRPEFHDVRPFEGRMRTWYYAFTTAQIVAGDEAEPELRCIAAHVGELID